MSDYDDVSPETALVATMIRHVTYVRTALLRVRQELERRSEVHDVSKWGPKELPGFVRINATARQHPYGSAEYRASIEAERGTVDCHQQENSHHPEHHERYSASVLEPDVPGLHRMGWIDIVEMVCDWWAAAQTYGTTDFVESLQVQRSRRDWSAEQWWLIVEVAGWLAGHDLRGLLGGTPGKPVVVAEPATIPDETIRRAAVAVTKYLCFRVVNRGDDEEVHEILAEELNRRVDDG